MRSSRAAASRAAASASATVPRSATRPPAAAIRAATCSAGKLRTLSFVAAYQTSTIGASARDHTVEVLVGRHREHHVHPVPGEGLGERPSEGVRAPGIVGAVDDEQRAAGHHLEAAGDPERPDRRPGRVGVERVPQHGLDRDDRRRHVPHRVLAERRDEELLVRRVHAFDAELLPPDRRETGRGVPVAPLEQERRLHLLGARLDHVQRVGRLLADHHDLPRLHDARLLGGDLPDGRAELRMVEPDLADHGDVAGDEVRRIPRPAHPDLEHPEPHRLVGEPQERERRHDLEVGRRAVPASVDHLEVRLEVLPLLGELLLGDLHAAEREALAHGVQVRAT